MDDLGDRRSMGLPAARYVAVRAEGLRRNCGRQFAAQQRLIALEPQVQYRHLNAGPRQALSLPGIRVGHVDAFASHERNGL